MKRIIAMLLAVMMVFALCACSNDTSNGDTAKDDGKADLTFATGGEQGTYYAFTGILAKVIGEDFTDADHRKLIEASVAKAGNLDA